MITFQDYSNYYDSLYKDKDYEAEMKFILNSLGKVGGKDFKKILSLGCGTCTYEVLLAKKGCEITGIDLSQKMLKLARQKLKKNGLLNKVALKQGDVRRFDVKEKHDLAIAMFNVVGYQIENQDMEEMLASTNSSLKKGAFLAFDCWHAPAVYQDPPGARERSVFVRGMRITRKTKSILLPTKNLIKITFDIVVSKKGRIVDKVKETHEMRYWTIPELKYFLDKTGFELASVVNFMGKSSKISDDKWDIFVIAKKK